MELLNFLKQIPFPVLLVAVLILLVVTLVIAFQYAKHKGLEGIREQVYQLILKAEHMYKESGTAEIEMGCSAGERITAKVATGYYVGRCAA